MGKNPFPFNTTQTCDYMYFVFHVEMNISVDGEILIIKLWEMVHMKNMSHLPQDWLVQKLVAHIFIDWPTFLRPMCQLALISEILDAALMECI